MKILMLQDDFPPQSRGGAGFSVFDLAQGLKKAGYSVSVVTTCQKKENEAEFDYEGLKVFRIYANYHERWRAYLGLYNPQTIGRVKRIIQTLKPDIVHAHNVHQYLSYHCLKIAKQEGAAVFFTARDVMPFSYGKLATNKYLKNMDYRLSWLDHIKQAEKRYNPLRNILIRKYLKYTDSVFAVSYALKDALQANGIGNVAVSHTGIDVKDWAISDEKLDAFNKKYCLENKKIIFFGGRISELKGSGQAERALQIVKKEIPNAILLVAGRGGIGWLVGDDLKAAYHAADVVLVPSLCFDSFPRSVLEAMACQKPVIATCFGGSPEIVQDNVTGYIINPLNVDLLAQKIIELLQNPQKAKDFGKAGFSRINQKFSRHRHIEQTINYYRAKI